MNSSFFVSQSAEGHSESLKAARRKVWRIRLTLNGLLSVFSMFAIFLSAVNFGSNLLFMLCFLQGGLLVSAFFAAWGNVKGVSLANVKVEPRYAGETLHYEVFIGTGGTGSHYLIELCTQKSELSSGEPIDLQTTGSTAVILADEQCVRGLKASRPLYAASTWPFGLFRFKRLLGELPEVIVYPQPAQRDRSSSELLGNQSHQKSQSDELVGVKAYQTGDSAHRIDWRVMARRDQLHVRVFDGGEGSESQWVEWPPEGAGSYEDKISELCRQILDYQNQHQDYGFRIPGVCLAPATSAAHMIQCLTHLAMMPVEESELSLREIDHA